MEQQSLIYLEEINVFKGFIERFHVNIKSACVELNNTKVQTVSFKHLMMFLERMMWGWRDVNSIIFLPGDKFNSVFAVPILARTIISDCITVQILDSHLKFSETGELVDDSAFLEQCKKLDGDFLNAFLGMGTYSGMDKEEYEVKKNKIKNHLPEFFEKGTDKIKIKGFNLSDGMKVLMEREKEESKFSIGLSIANSKYLYKWFSQFEHCSPYTKEILYKRDKENFVNFLSVLDVSCRCALLIFLRLKFSNASVKNIYELSVEVTLWLLEYHKQFPVKS